MNIFFFVLPLVAVAAGCLMPSLGGTIRDIGPIDCTAPCSRG